MAGIGEAAKRDILSYARGIEMEADQAGLSYLEATGQSGVGMLVTFRRLADDTLLLARDANPYLLSHPLPRERVALLENAVGKSKFRGRKDPAALQRRHDMMRAKISGFFEARERVAKRYPASDTSLPARYARAILAYRFDGAVRAAPLIDALIQAEPGNPYFWELKGQSYLEAGRPRDAIPPLRKAVSLASAQGSQSGLLRILLGQALVDSGDSSLTEEAIKNLNVGLLADPAASSGYRTLARAYAAKGDIGQAQLATAQGLLAEGKVDDAKLQAKRAQAKLKEGSPAWLRADDIVAYKPPPSKDGTFQ
jgi:predicted Zn-dependent protease